MVKILIKIIIAVVIACAAKIILYVIERILNKRIEKGLSGKINKQRNETVIKLLKNAIKFIVYFLAVIFILDLFGVNTASLLATAGIGGVAIAFGAQALVQDVIGGMTILLENSYAVGDYVNIDGIEGTIVELGMRRTIIQDYDMSYIIIPNGNITKIRNYSRDNMRAEIIFPVSYKISFEEARDVVLEMANDLKDDPNVVEGPSLLGIDEFTDFSYKIKISSVVKEGKNFEYMRKYREIMFEKFRTRGYEFPLDNFSSEDKNEEI